MERSDETSPEANQSVYGDGNAASRIVAALAKSHGLQNRSAPERTRSHMYGLAELATTGLRVAEEQAWQPGASL
jgi:hypothetical protein